MKKFLLTVPVAANRAAATALSVSTDHTAACRRCAEECERMRR